MVDWDFTASAYIINVYYSSTLNESYWKVPKTVEVDDCGPANIISPGYALWLVLVPAVACAVQLPGSVFFYGRSNFYRFAPEMGLADCLSTWSLLVGALLKGYRWRESVAAVFVVREGIGRGDLWWRRPHLDAQDHQRPPSPSTQVDTSQPSTINASGDPDGSASTEVFEEYRISNRLRPYSRPLSVERIIGAVLFVLATIKTIAILCTSGTNKAMQITTLVALSYCTSFVLFEILVWSLAFGARGYSLEDIPYSNLIDLLVAVDPGDNPFTFPSEKGVVESTTRTDVELASAATGTGALAQPSASTQSPVPWKASAAMSALLLAVASLGLWSFILYMFWTINNVIFYATLSTASVAVLRTVDKVCSLAWRLSLSRVVTGFSGVRPVVEKMSKVLKRLDCTLRSDSRLFVVRWLLDRITTANMVSAVWLVIICTYFIALFPQEGEDSLGDGPAKPAWLDWIG